MMTESLHPAEIVVIVALAHDNAIGRGGDLLFHLRDDLRRFKALTMGSPIIMGRKTFESFPKGPLPGRLNIVVTRNTAYAAPEGVVVTASLEDAIAAALASNPPSRRIFIIGGGEIYRQALPLAHTLELTLIEASVPDADTFFPAFDPAQWRLVATEEADPESLPPHRFVTLRRL